MVWSCGCMFVHQANPPNCLFSTTVSCSRLADQLHTKINFWRREFGGNSNKFWMFRICIFLCNVHFCIACSFSHIGCITQVPMLLTCPGTKQGGFAFFHRWFKPICKTFFYTYEIESEMHEIINSCLNNINMPEIGN